MTERRRVLAWDDGAVTWIAPEVERPEGPLTGPERPMLQAFLDWQRATLLYKCAGLTGEQLARRAIPPSELSLLGLLRHMTKVERIWFRMRFAGEPHAEPDPLHLGHVPQQPEQGQLGRRNGPAGQLLAGQAGALVEQRRALPVQERLQHRAFGTGQRPFGSLNLWGYPRHGAIIPCQDAAPFRHPPFGLPAQGGTIGRAGGDLDGALVGDAAHVDHRGVRGQIGR